MHVENSRFVKGQNQLDHYDVKVLKTISLRMARRWCFSPEQAEEIAQESLLRFLMCRRQVQKPNAWFYLVTRRLATREWSRTIRREEAERDSQTPHPNLSDSLDFFIDVKKILGMLPDRDQKILELAISGASHRELASRFGRPVRDVGQMLARARQKAWRARDDLLREDYPIKKSAVPVIKRPRRVS